MTVQWSLDRWLPEFLVVLSCALVFKVPENRQDGPLFTPKAPLCFNPVLQLPFSFRIESQIDYLIKIKWDKLLFCGRTVFVAYRIYEKLLTTFKYNYSRIFRQWALNLKVFTSKTITSNLALALLKKKNDKVSNLHNLKIINRAWIYGYLIVIADETFEVVFRLLLKKLISKLRQFIHST